MSQPPSPADVDPAQGNDKTSTGDIDPHTTKDQDSALPDPVASLTAMSSSTPVPKAQLQPLAIEPTTLSQHIPPPLFSPTFRPGSPVNRKRSEVKDDDILSSNEYFLQNAGSFYSLGGSSGTRTGGSGGGNGSKSSPFPPLKKSKTSPPLSHSNLTAYRSSREAQDPLSPQTSPIIEPFEAFEAFDAISTETISAIALDPTTTPTTTDAPSLSRRSSGSTHKGGTPPLLRARTMEEISSRPLPSSVLDSLSKASTTAIGNLNLGGGSGRGILPERAMGVITSRPNSRQGSPTVTMTSRESTPMYADEYSVLESPHPLSRVKSNKREHSVTPSEDTVSSEDGLQRRNILDTLEDYNEEADPDYEPAADTTVDEEGDMRQSSVDPDDEDSFGEIDENNIHNAQFEVEFDDDGDDAAFYGELEEDDETLDAADAFVDTDPECKDRFTDVEITALDEEARTEGIVHMIQKYVISDMYPMKKLLLMFFPEPEIVAFPKAISKRQVFDYLSSKWQEDLSRRKRLEHVHKLEQVIELLKSSKKIMVLTGAGVSVSCGIPDFRSPDGIYSRLSEFQLRDPQQMFDLRFFRRRPEIFYSFAREIFPSNFTPSPSHNFIKLLEDKGKLLRNYTQNIDTLEQKAGIHNILQCHGSFATASCVRCHHQVPGDEIKDSIFNQQVAYCKVCTAGETEPYMAKASTLKVPASSNRSMSKARISSSLLDDSSSSSSSEDELDEDPPALMKPDIVFFGEPLPSGFNDHLEDDRLEADLLIVIGSSLKVAPVSDIMLRLPPKIPQILINRTPITHTEFDVQLLGNCDTIVAELCRMAGWELQHDKLPEGTSNVTNMDTNTNTDGAGAGGRAHWSLVEPNTYLFEGAILGDIEYESSQKRQLATSTSAGDVLASGINKGRKRGRFENRHFGGVTSSGGDGSSSDADDEGAWSSRRYGRSRERMEMDHIHVESDSDDDKSDTSQVTITKGDFITIAAESLGPSGSGATGASWSPYGVPSSFRVPTPTFGPTSGAAIVLSSSAPTASFGFGIPKAKSKGTSSGNTSDHQTKTSSFFQTIKGFDIPTASPARPVPLTFSPAPFTFSPAPPHSNQGTEPGSASLESRFQVFENANELHQDLRDLDEDEDDDDQFYQHIELELRDDDDQEDELYDTPRGEVEEPQAPQGAEPMSESDPVYMSGHGKDPHSSFHTGQYLAHPEEEDMKMPSPSPQLEDRGDSDPGSVEIDDETYQDAEEDLDGDMTHTSSMSSGSSNPLMQNSGNQRMQANQSLSYALSSPSQSFIEAFMNEDSPSPPPGPFSLTQSHQYQQPQDPPHQE